MNSISLEMETPTASSFAAVRQNNPYTLYLTPTRPRPRFGRFRVLLVSACAIVATACASLSAPGNGDEEPITQADLDAVQSEADQAMAAAKAAEAALSEAQAAADAAVRAAQAEAEQARADAAAAQSDAQQSLADATVAQQDAARARAAESEAMAKVDAMMMAAHHPSEVMVSPDMLDISLLNLDQAQASLAGRDSIYVSSIGYDGAMYSALLKYEGGTTATVEAIFGSSGKLIPDTVGLGMTELSVLAPDKLVVSNVEVGGVGYSGELQYVGGNRLQVAGIRRVALPPTAAEQIAALEAELAAAQAAADAAMADADAAMADKAAAMADADAAMADKAAAMADAEAAMADKASAMADADAARAAADASAAEAAAAMAKVDAMMMAAHQPSEVMVSAAMLDPNLANIDNAQVSLAGPDSIYISNILYAGVPYSALLKYSGGTSATVEAVYGPIGKLIPDSVGLSQTELTFVPPASLEVANVEVGGVGYSGTLEYAGGNQLHVTGIRRVTLPPTAAEAAQAAAAAAIAQAEADAAAAVSEAQAAADAAVSAAEAEAAAAMADMAAAMADADAAMADAEAARAAADASAAEAEAALAKVDAMMMDAYQPSEVMVSAAMLDPSMANIDNVQVSLAGPDAIYLSNIMYAGVPYSALLRYRGGTSATVEAVYGPMGKLIPDSVGLSQTELAFVAPASLAVENVEVGGVGYSGTLEYAGGNQLRVTGIRRVDLPPTAAEMAQAENESLKTTIAEQSDQIAALEAALAEAEAATAAAMAEGEAATAAAMAEAEAAMADAEAAMAEATAAQAQVDAMMMAAYQPSEVMVSAAMLDPSMANIDNAQVSLAGPDSIYISNIMYAGAPYSALLKYSGGTSATVEAVYGPMGKLIPDSVGLSQVELDFVAPASLNVSNVEVGGVGYSGTLEYAGGNQLRVTGIRRVTLPPTAEEAAAAAIAEAEADAAAAVSAAQAATDAAMADAEAAHAAADAAMAEAAAATADAEAARAEAAAAQAKASAAQAEASAAQAQVDAMMMAAYQPSEVMVSAAMLDPSMANIDNAQVSLAGPDSIYISNIMYAGAPYSALLKYSGGTSATVEAVYGPMGKLIPDSVGLSQVELDFVAPASLNVSNVEVGGVGYSGTLEYAGGNQLRVTGIRRVTLPPTEAEAAAAAIAKAEADAAAAVSAAQAAADAAVSEARAAADMAVSEAQAAADAAVSAAMADAEAARAEAAAARAEASAAQAEVDAMMMAAYQPSEVMVSAAMLDPSMANIDNAQVSLAGPDSIYISNIMYAGAPYSALLKYSGGTSATVEAVYGPMGKLIPDSVGLSQVELDFVAPASLNVSNVEVGGVGYSGTLEYAGGNQLRVTGIRRVTLPPTEAEAAQAAAAAAIAQAEADAAAAVSDAQAAADAAIGEAQAAADMAVSEAQAAADMAVSEAQAAADMAVSEAQAAADAAVSAAMADAEAAQAKVDAMMMAAYQPSEVMVSAAMLDPSLANIDNAQVSLAGPDSIYISNIVYAGAPYSALLKYSGGTSATIEAVYGPMGKLIPDSVGLSQVELDFVAPASLNVSNVEVGGVGYSGTLEYAGGNQLRVTGIRRVTLPPTAEEAAAAAIAEAEADAAAAVSAAQAAADAAVSAAQGAADEAMADAAAAQAAADAATADADAAMADADAARAEAEAAQAKVDAMMAAAYQPSEVMVSAAMLDPGMANIDNAQVSLAGPDSIYISNIMYAGAPYSALLKYSGGTSATVEAVYGPMGKLIPDSVGLSQVELDFVAPASLNVSNVEVGGVGYSGTLEYAGGNQLRVTGIRQVTLPPTAAEAAQAAAEAAIAKAEADAAATVSAAQAAAEAAVSEAQAAANAAVSEAQAAADKAMADAEAAQAAADAAQAAADAAAAEAEAAQAKVDAMMAPHPAEVMVSAAMLDPSMASLDQVQVSLAGPDTIYVSNIMYGGMPYSALLTYSGGTSATVEAVYGPMGKLIPDSVGLSQVELAFVAPASVEVSNVEVGGVGYAGTLEYAGGNQLRVTGIRRVTLPPTAAELARAEAAAAMADAEQAKNAAAAAMADADAARGDAMAANAKVEELEARIKVLTDGIPLVGINPGLLDLQDARLTIAGPDSIYLSGIQYAGKDVSTRIRYSQGTGTAEAIFESTSDLADVLNMHAAQVELAGDALVVSNVGIRGRAHTLTLTFNDEGRVDISARDDGWAVRTVGELRRDKLITEGTYLCERLCRWQAAAERRCLERKRRLGRTDRFRRQSRQVRDPRIAVRLGTAVRSYRQCRRRQPQGRLRPAPACLRYPGIRKHLELRTFVPDLGDPGSVLRHRRDSPAVLRVT